MHSEYFVDMSISLLPFNLAHFIQFRPEDWQSSLAAMIELVAQGKLRVQMPKTYSLKEAAQAHSDIESRRTMGKVVLVP